MKTFGNGKSLLYLGFLVVGVTAAVIVVTDMGRSTDPSGNPLPSLNELESQPALYANTDFKITLRYPRTWQPDSAKGGFRGNSLAFRGEDGFFGIDAVGAVAEIPIDQAAEDTVNAGAHLYGSSPTITPTTLAGMEARLILPSTDQPPERVGEAAFIVRYPKSLIIASSTYFYLVLYGDKDHLQSLGDTLSFVFD